MSIKKLFKSQKCPKIIKKAKKSAIKEKIKIYK